ncbi:DedA family protein [Roseivivax sp. CAU 1753]
MSGWITQFLSDNGYWAVALFMFIENVFPPIPSEIVMPLAGYTASTTGRSLVLMILAGLAGSVAGALFWYWIGIRIGTSGLRRVARRYGRWLTLTPSDVDKADGWFDRHGHKAVFAGRLIPGVRTLISVPAGLSEITFRRFMIYTTLGTALWTTALTLAGWELGQNYEAVASYMGPVSNVIIAGMVLWYLYRVVTFRPKAEAIAANDVHAPASDPRR